MDYLIGLDIGTSSVKGVLLNPKGEIVHSERAKFVYETFPDGRVEIGAKAYLDACFFVMRGLAEKTKGNRIKGVCASSASGNLLLLNKDNQPMTNIISWQDKRVSEEAKEVLGDMDTDDFYRRIGWPFGGKAFPLAQLCYMKKHHPEWIEECGKVCMSTEYLYYVLTGKWGISVSAGTTFFLIDQEKGRYIESLLDTLGIDEEKLPLILPCGQILGKVEKEMESSCGIPGGTPVVLGSFDHPSAARGVGVLKEGEALLSCGTSWVVFFPVSDREKAIQARMLVDPYLSPGGCYGAMSSIASLSERLKLYVNRYIDDSDQAFHKLSELAKQSSPGAKGLRINPLKEPEDEKINAFAKEEIARAIMEGTVELLKQKLELLESKSITAKSAIMVGGPSEDPYWVQLIEQICGISVRVIHESFAGAVGAALIAGIGVDAKERSMTKCLN